LRFFAAAQLQKDLAADEVDALIFRDKLFGGVESGEGFAIFSLALIEAAQREERDGLAGIVTQGFAKGMLGFVVFLQL
jgi:hypothetical protein